MISQIIMQMITYSYLYILTGDSSGPLTGGIETMNEFGITKIKNFQFGIVSVGAGCRKKNDSTGIYTNVAHYMKWILDQMDQ